MIPLSISKVNDCLVELFSCVFLTNVAGANLLSEAALQEMIEGIYMRTFRYAVSCNYRWGRAIYR